MRLLAARTSYPRKLGAAHARRSLAAGLALAASSACAAGCGSPDAPTRPRWTLTAAAPSAQVGLAGGEVTPPTVEVRDSSGNRVAGIPVRFGVEQGGGRIDVERTTTDLNGQASARYWVLGSTLGLQRVRAQVVGEPRASAVFDATAIPVAGPLDSDARCPQPDSLRPSSWQLARTSGRVAGRLPLAVVAIGSSSTVGIGASIADSAYPALLQRHLRRLFPASAATVHNAGREGERLDQLQARIARDVAARAPHLVVLQTGTIDAIQRVDPDVFARQLRDVLDQLAATGADVVMLDSQRYPDVGESASYRAMQQLMRQVAAERGVPLVRRYDVMTYWVTGRIYTYPQVLAPDLFHPSDLTYSCTARALSEGIYGTVRGLAGR